MDSNSSSYLVLVATVALLAIVFFFLSGMKRKPQLQQKPTQRTQPLEIRTTHIFQLLTYLWIPLTISLPVLVFKEIHPTAYFVFILVMMVVLLSWFIAAQHALERDHDDES